MNRAEISDIAHRRHPIAAPVSPEHARRLLSWLSPPTGGRVVDLGCGSGEWLLELLARHGDLRGVGVDLALPPEVGSQAERRGVADRVEWVQADASSLSDGVFDVVLCVGASHAFGGLADTLEAIRHHMLPGGQALLGDTIWDAPPSPAAQKASQAGPDDFPNLAGLVEIAGQHSFEPGYGHVSTLEEWDDYEWSWTGSLVEWALHEAPTPTDRERVLTVARDHRNGWLNGHRKQLGFATLVLYDLLGTAAPAGR